MKTNFTAAPEASPQDSLFMILPVPYEFTTSWKKGTKDAPQAILDASHELELYDIETKSEPYIKGIFTKEPLSVKDAKSALENLKKEIKSMIQDNKIPLVLGGEHTITLYYVKALKELGKDFSVLQLDAHADLRDEFEDDKLSHACVMRRIHELNPHITQVGIRSMDIEEADFLNCNPEIKTFYAHHIKNHDLDTWTDLVVESLKKNVFITLDIDVMENILTGTPEPGGLTWHEITSLLRKVAKAKNILGFDIVELLPGDHASDFAAAKLVYKMMAYISPTLS